MKGAVYLILPLAVAVQGQVNTWGQCGGINYTGSNSCVSGAYCSTMNPYYAQCIPGAGPTATTTTTRTTSTTTSGAVGTPTRSRTTSVVTTVWTTMTTTSRTTTTTSRTTTTTSRTSSTPVPTSGGGGGSGSPPGSTLISPYLWIRAVVSPYFHKYLQSQTPRTVGNAVLGNPSTAGQFNIVDGQLVQLIDTSGTVLYGKIEERVDSSQTKLLLTWGTSPSSYGTFIWNGDALIWRNPSISRQNEAAWLICDNAKVYANLGAYGYMTPTGCSDATIHYYNGATAVE